MDRSQVKTLHRAVDTALESVAKAQGFVYRPGTMRFGDAEVTGRVTFVLSGKTAVVDQRYATNGLKVGDQVTVPGDGEMRTYTITSFTPRGGAHITRIGDGRKFRCPQHRLVKVGAAGAVMGLSPNQIVAFIKKAAPGLNHLAAKQMFQSWTFQAKFGKKMLPVNETEVIQRVGIEVRAADLDMKKHPVAGIDGIASLNEAADEMAAEARMS